MPSRSRSISKLGLSGFYKYTASTQSEIEDTQPATQLHAVRDHLSLSDSSVPI